MWKHASSIWVSADNRKRPDLEVRGFDRGILGDVISNNPPTNCSNTSILDLNAAAAERVKCAEFQKYSIKYAFRNFWLMAAGSTGENPLVSSFLNWWLTVQRTQELTREHWSTTGKDISQWLYRSLSRRGYSHVWANSTPLHCTTKATGPVRLLIRVYFVTNLSNIT